MYTMAGNQGMRQIIGKIGAGKKVDIEPTIYEDNSRQNVCIFEDVCDFRVVENQIEKKLANEFIVCFTANDHLRGRWNTTKQCAL